MTQYNSQGVAVWESHAGVSSNHLALEQGTALFCEVRRSRNVDTASGNISIMGHLVALDTVTRVP